MSTESDDKFVKAVRDFRGEGCASDDCMVGTYSSGLGSDTVLVYRHDELVNSLDFYSFKFCPKCGNKIVL